MCWLFINSRFAFIMKKVVDSSVKKVANWETGQIYWLGVVWSSHSEPQIYRKIELEKNRRAKSLVLLSILMAQWARPTGTNGNEIFSKSSGCWNGNPPYLLGIGFRISRNGFCFTQNQLSLVKSMLRIIKQIKIKQKRFYKP